MKKILPLIAIVAVVVIAYFILLPKKEKTTMQQAKPDLTISAPELYAAFRQDESAANEQYLNKTVTVLGEIMEVGKSKNGMPRLKLFSKGRSFGVQCTLDAQSPHLRLEYHPGESVSLKCICMDYYNDVELTNCVEEGRGEN